MNITLRLEQPADHHRVESITRQAFWDVYKPGCNEHYIVHTMRNSPDFIPQLDFVACDDSLVIGHILYTRAKVVGDREHAVLCLGPVTVDPDHQKKGVGSQLIRHSLNIARELNHKGVILFGSPAYYPRFGFVSAQKYNISTRDGQNFDPFMALELTPGALTGVTGRFHESKTYFPDPADVEAYDKRFPPREKHVLPGQLH